MAKQIEKLIRIAGSDIDGDKNTYVALTSIKGVSFMFSNAICNTLNLNKKVPAEELTEEQIKKVEELIQKPSFPSWLLNRRNEPATGEDKHLTVSDVRFVRDQDILTLKKIKSYKGLRHQWGLPLRGQKTKSNFRRNKGKATGVKRKK